LLNFLIPTQCGTSTHTWISNNLPLKCESLLYHIDTLPLERKTFSTRVHYSWPPSLVPPFTHLYGTRLPEINIRKTFDTWSNCTRPGCKPTALIPLVGRIQGGNTREISNNENWVNPYKRMTPPSTQNLKALCLRVFFLICCSTFSFLPNVRLRLTLEYLTSSNTFPTRNRLPNPKFVS